MNIKLYPQTFDEFAQQAQHSEVVPVVGTMSTHSFDAIDVFIKLSRAARYAFLFESVEGEERVAQYSFVGADPYMIVRGRGNQTIVEQANSVVTLPVCAPEDRKSTRLNSSHLVISYAVFCLKKKNK